MSQKTKLLVFSAIVLIAVASASYAYLQMKVITEERDRFEQISNNLQEEVLRLQEVAIQAEANAMEAREEANRWKSEVAVFQKKLLNCK